MKSLAVPTQIKSYLTFTNIKRLVGILALLIGIFTIGWCAKPSPAPIITQLPGKNTVIQLPGKETVVLKDVIKYVKVEDRAAVELVMAENKKLKATIQQLTVSQAEQASTGHGTVTVTPNPTEPTHPTYLFDDWRLNFVTDGKTADYTLSQKYVVVNSVGKTADNVPVNIVRLFEIDAKGQRVPITTVETTTVAIGPPVRHWYVRPTIQFGAMYMPKPTVAPATATTPATFGWSGTVAIPWLKRGVTTATEDTRYAFLTPAATFNDREATIGVLPFSLNVGSLKHVPLTNLWVSPYLGIDPKYQQYRWGLAISATF